MRPVRWARYSVQVVAVAIFTYQMLLAVEKYLKFASIPTVETNDIAEANLPDIYICRPNPNISEILDKHGYHFGMPAFYVGRIKNGYDFVTWEGKNNITYENFTRQLFFDIADNIFFAFDGFCEKIGINSSKISHSKPFYTYIVQSGNLNSKISIGDTGRTPYYMINSEALKGDSIEVEAGFDLYYSLELEEIHWNEESGDCTNYGEDAAFDTFADCVANEHDSIFRPILGCMVPWLSGPEDPTICKGRVKISAYNLTLLFDEVLALKEKVRLGNMISHTNTCLKPCLELRAFSTLKKRVEEEYYVTFITFPKTVKVTKYQKAYGLFDLVVEVGSSLGLWIGISALGVFDLLHQAGTNLKEIFKKIKGNGHRAVLR